MRKLLLLLAVSLSIVSCAKSSDVTSTRNGNDTTKDRLPQNPPGRAADITPAAFSVDNVSSDEVSFDIAIFKNLLKVSVPYDFEQIVISESKYNSDRTWSSTGDFVTLSLRGGVCKTIPSLEVTGYQNQYKRLLDLAAGLNLPFRVSTKNQTLLNMPKSYEDPSSAFGRGFPIYIKIKKAINYAEVVSKLNKPNRLLLALTNTANDRMSVTLFKQTEANKYLLIRLDYAPSICPDTGL